MVFLSTKKKRVPVHGVILLDKPVGYSSNDSLIQIKRLLNAEKAGHTGTLDPFATGLLPLCFGEATKFAQDLLDADKTYETVVHLGITTDTGDTEGKALSECSVSITPKDIDNVISGFIGEIDQTPPMYSALKRDGKPLYEYARAGISVERETRRVKIHSLEVLDYQKPYLSLRVNCSKGTYIRVLGEDIGVALGCGGHLNALRRTRVGSLLIDRALTLDSFAAFSDSERVNALAPVDTLLSSFPSLDLPEELAERFLCGQRIALVKEGQQLLPSSYGRVRVYRESNRQLLGTAQLKEFGILAPERLIASKTLQ